MKQEIVCLLFELVSLCFRVVVCVHLMVNVCKYSNQQGHNHYAIVRPSGCMHLLAFIVCLFSPIFACLFWDFGSAVAVSPSKNAYMVWVRRMKDTTECLL